MRIYLKMKSAGKRRPILDHVPYEIKDETATLRELLEELVKLEVARYNEKPKDNPKEDKESQLLEALMPKTMSSEEVNEQAAIGKVGFGRIYSDKKIDLKKAIENAIQCYQDGLVRVFQNDAELTDLNEPLQIQSEDTFTLIRLTFLAGRYW